MTDAALDQGALYDAPYHLQSARLDRMSPNAAKVFGDRYVRKDSATGQPVETPRGTMWRLATTMAGVKPDEDGLRAIRYFHLLADMRMLPNSPTFTGAGTPLGNLSACFVLPIEDDMGGHPDGIFQTLRNAALIQKTGGGNGFSFSRLRSKGAPVRSSAGKASGPVSFLKVFNQAFEAVNQGGARRGANMGVMRCDHPDIVEFITSKFKEGDLANFNISVALTNDFMDAVVADETWNLIEPSTGLTTGTYNARDLFELITSYAWQNGEPGCLFIDQANATNPVPHLGSYEATNPCAEQWLLPYESCNLGCINLPEHVTLRDQRWVIDWRKLQSTIGTSVEFLDDVVEANKYVPEVPQLREMALTTRRIGLGIMGLADLFMILGIRYGSSESLDAASQLMEFIRFHALAKSNELATLHGAFPACDGSVYWPAEGAWEPPVQVIEHDPSLLGRPSLGWEGLRHLVHEYGVRNATQVTIAPTGTRATVADCEGYGCEPVFALAHQRTVTDVHSAEGSQILYYTSNLFATALGRSELDVEEASAVLAEVAKTGSCQRVATLPSDIRRVFTVAGDLTPTEHVRMQAVLQTWIDSSISKTINMPNEATIEDVQQTYMLAWASGCKGITVYREGSRDKVVLEVIKQVEPECTDEVCVTCG